MTGTFLTRDELRELTDAKRRDGQIAWLEERGWPFETTCSGWPVVLRAYAEKRLGLRDARIRRATPDFSAV